MNVALPALIVFFLLLPGFIFRTHLKRAERTSLDFSPFGQVAVEAILWTLGLHLIWLVAANLIFRRDFEPTVLMELLSSAPTIQASALDAFGRQFYSIASYFLTLICVSFALPKAIRTIISHYRLDRADAPLSFLLRFHQAPWYYLLTGADFSVDEEPDLIVVSAVVEIGKEPMLFVGVLDEFYVDADGQLDRLVLQEVVRRPFSADKGASTNGEAGESRFYPIDGDSFVLRYSEAITLNVQYVRLTPESTVP